ncbi:MAG: hypothetical protein DRP09_20265 [Candidatus Thorarchaeota archaeon]|nr:MAG: hypothetical protein DRP09_20265 [Candidatus Thorarchaeota archaeon]
MEIKEASKLLENVELKIAETLGELEQKIGKRIIDINMSTIYADTLNSHHIKDPHEKGDIRITISVLL